MSFPRYRHPPWGTAWKILKARAGFARVPLIVNVCLTYRCNLRCAYCGVSEGAACEMDTATVLRLVDEIANAGAERLSLGGGEPMLRKDVGTIVRHAKMRGLTVNLMSNGLHIPQRIGELAGLDFLAVSLDGPQPVHDQARGYGAFLRAVEGIRAARAAGVEVWTTTVLTRHNVGRLPEIIELAALEGVRATFLPVMAEGLKARNTSELAPDRAAFVEAMDYLLAERARPGTPLAASRDLLLFYRNRWGRAPASPRPGAWHAGVLPCQAGRLFCSVSPDGRLFPCNFLQASTGGASIAEQGFSTALKRLDPTHCGGCWCDSFIEANLVFDFRPGAIRHVLGLLSSKPGGQA